MGSTPYSLERETEDEIAKKADLLGIVFKNDNPILEDVRKMTKPRTVFPTDEAVRVREQVRGRLIIEECSGCRSITLAKFVYEEGMLAENEGTYELVRVSYRDDDGKKKRVSFVTEFLEPYGEPNEHKTCEVRGWLGWKVIPETPKKEPPHDGYAPCASVD